MQRGRLKLDMKKMQKKKETEQICEGVGGEVEERGSNWSERDGGAVRGGGGGVEKGG